MIVSAIFRSASTQYCYKLANDLGLSFVDEVFDPLNDDILRMKRLNHEFSEILRELPKKNSLDFKMRLWHDHSGYVLNNHNYDIPWFEKADLFFSRKDLLGCLVSMNELIRRSSQPQENIWIYADWMRRWVEYVLSYAGNRPIVLAENLGYQFNYNSHQASDFIISVFSKKMTSGLLSDWSNLIKSNAMTYQDVLNQYGRK